MDVPEPKHRDALWNGESFALENSRLRLVLYRRQGGWGWGELYGPEENDGGRRFLGVMEHLGEADVVGHVHPLRLEADDYELVETEGGRELRFEVGLQTPEEPCWTWGGAQALEGQVCLSLADDEPSLRYRLEVKPNFRLDYRYLRGPWLRVGAYGTGGERTDAIFPGIEWLIGDEWSSGTDFHCHCNALRVTPHPHKVTIPMMAMSQDGLTVTLSWPPRQSNVGTLSRIRGPQPVFASPNFIDRRPEHAMGLMYPTAADALDENALKADPPARMERSGLTMEAEIGVHEGASLDAVKAWVARRGMPGPGQFRWPRQEAIERIARGYDTNLWEEGKGWTYNCPRVRNWVVLKSCIPEPPRRPHMYPQFIDWYIENGKNRSLAESLREKVEWCRAQGPFVDRRGAEFLRWYSDEELREMGEFMLERQTDEGDFPFDPQGLHQTNHLRMADRWRPLGLPGDSALDLCATAAVVLISIGEALDEERFVNAARKTLDFAVQWDRPEGGDWWETPLHSPNLLTAAHACLAYWAGWKTFGVERYRSRARHFLRALLPFTYLWEPKGTRLLYDTKPLWGTTGWHYMAWTDRCVLWQVLLFFDLAAQLGLDCAELDPELDWATYRRGALAAGLRWVIDSNDEEWMLKCEDTSEEVAAGAADMALADVHDPVDDMFGGLGLRIDAAHLAAMLVEAVEDE